MRAILAIIVAYIATVLVIFAGFTAAWMALGVDGSFEPGTWEVSPVWSAIGVVLACIAAVVGGFVCIKIGKSMKTNYWLAGIVLVLGALSAVAEISKPDTPDERPAEVVMQDAMMTARSPIWYNILLPFIGAGGAVLGGKLGAKKELD